MEPVVFLDGRVSLWIGDCLDALAAMDADSVDCVVTSPPYWGLRDYGVDGQIGLEPTLGEHLDVMVRVFEAVRRVLKPTGTLWFHPTHYAGYHPEPEQDAYTKKTGLWTFNGFVMPDKKPLDPVQASKMWKMAPSDDRADQRSATPLGFSIANFIANCPEDLRRVAA